MLNAGMIYGYARVSTVAQDLATQLAQLKAVGVTSHQGLLEHSPQMSARRQNCSGCLLSINHLMRRHAL
jgi:DNA invertase Pin-like site-specific DNA recombinase